MTDPTEKLCYRDPRNPYFLDLGEDTREPRIGCFCDNCFYGRDALALEIIALRAKLQAADAEVARLTDCLKTANGHHEHFERRWYLCLDRIAELEAEVAILKDVRATEQYLASLPVGDKELDFAKRTATEAALRFVQKRWPHFYLNESDIRGAIKALLGEGR